MLGALVASPVWRGRATCELDRSFFGPTASELAASHGDVTPSEVSLVQVSWLGFEPHPNAWAVCTANVPRSTFHLLFQSCMTVVVCCAAPLATIAGHSVTSGHLVLGLSLSLSIRSKSVPNMLKGFSSFSEAGLMECSS